MTLGIWLLAAAVNAPPAPPPEVDAYVHAPMDGQKISGLALSVVRLLLTASRFRSLSRLRCVE